MSTPNPIRHSPQTVTSIDPVASPANPQIEVSLTQNIDRIAAGAASGARIFVPEYRRTSPLIFSPLALLGLAGCQSDPCRDGVCSDPEPPSGMGDAGGDNQFPQFHDLSDQSIGVGETLRLRFRVSDPDFDDLTVQMNTAIGGPIAEGATLNRLTTNVYELHWTPQPPAEGDYPLVFRVSDGTDYAFKEINIHVWNGISGAGGMDGGTSDGGTGGTGGMDGGEPVHHCDGPGLAIGTGTAASPYEFRVMVMVEETTRQYALDHDHDIEGAIANLFSGLNATFNNGQLAAFYNFIPIDIQYPTLDPSSVSYLPRPDDTPEADDLILLFDQRHWGSGASYSAGTIIFKGNEPFAPEANLQGITNHEVGHFRGAIDLYNIHISGDDNLIFPGSAFLGNVPGIMGAPNTGTWDPLSIGLINMVAGDPEKSAGCALRWLQEWVPETIRLQVKDGMGLALPSVSIDFYRRKQGAPLSPADLWFSGVTDSEGKLLLPDGITTTTPSAGWIYNGFLAVVHLAGEDYLNWYNIADIVVPYISGESELNLMAEASSETIYNVQNTDLILDSISSPPLSAAIGDTIPRAGQFHNSGPDTITGLVALQFYLSTDTTLDPHTDLAFGGFAQSVTLAAGEISNFSFPSGTIPNLTPGSYYLLGDVKILNAEDCWDPDHSNDSFIAPTPVVITSP